ncbi:hypothetical protein [Pseudoduganella violaceinigra]|uniref:hypothetical protein n=1 Tax=Pseudoduganella violaceinigra TaxID=246602 RepID=UPI001E648D86|nr:hypothetical protein [Pseudoduganella violaceinigra]
MKNVDSDQSLVVERNTEFASPRMLIADFTMAEYQLKAAIKSLRRGFLPPQVLIHPMEQIEGGVTQVEYRIFYELALGTGASKAGIHVGQPLSGDSVGRAIREYRL